MRRDKKEFDKKKNLEITSDKSTKKLWNFV